MNPSNLHPLDNAARVMAQRLFGEGSAPEVVAHGDTRVYRVRRARDFVLRLHVPLVEVPDNPPRSAQSVESECMWLSALSTDTNLIVPRPVTARSDGAFVDHVEREDGSPVACSALEWIEGKPFEGPRDDAFAHGLGEKMATLHGHARAWTAPPGFEVPVHDREAWPTLHEHFEPLVEAGTVSADDVERLKWFLAAAEEQPRMPTGKSVGLIHGDFHDGNLLQTDSGLAILDFGRAGVGAWLYDLGQALQMLPTAVRRACVDAYAETFPVDSGDVRVLEEHFVGSFIETLAHHAPNPEEVDYLVKAIPLARNFADLYLEDRSFLFGLE